MRIVSLVPSATDIALALGAARDLVAVTHESDLPAELASLPRLTRSTIPDGATSREIDEAVRAAAERAESTFHLDADALAAADPDVILGQTLCAVCAVTLAQVPRSASGATIVPLGASTVEGVFADIVRVGEAIGREGEAARLVAVLRARVERIRALVADASRPTVACLEWLDPIFNAGHWIPEQVDAAGGIELLGRPGLPSVAVPDDRLFESDPDVIVLLPCGFDAERARAESARLRSDGRWPSLRAVRDGRVYAVDGDRYFSRPGPGIVDGIELLASLLHPDRVRRRLPAIALA